jgi:hypothetical protein
MQTYKEAMRELSIWWKEEWDKGNRQKGVKILDSMLCMQRKKALQRRIKLIKKEDTQNKP